MSPSALSVTNVTDIEKRFLFYKVQLPLLDFERERETIDLSKVVLTHHALKNKGRQAMPLCDGTNPTPHRRSTLDRP